ncbi:undecaprenyl-diphosphate phosphatase [Candidatus Dojkabacteria bacterium]|jgi:undecaprenyl-diphosphatase|nr:undecaprenyl-diphosphate phosphatase [Candidatus Dojkabacteria bacterium]
MNTIQSIVLSVIQGVTELLPISSTGHILLVSELFFKNMPNILLLTILQLGTTVAIVVAYRELIFKNLFTKKKWMLFLKIAVGSIPAIIAALLFQDLIEKYLHANIVIAISLIFWGILMIIVENIQKYKGNKTLEMENISFKQILLVGVAQAFAIIPGTSRSGSTTVVGVMAGIEKYTAITFSFLLGLPILIGSFGYEVFKMRDNLGSILTVNNGIAVVISFIFGFISIIVLKKISKKRFLTYFGIYRLILGVLIIFLL